MKITVVIVGILIMTICMPLMAQDNKQELHYRVESPDKQYAIDVNGFYWGDCTIDLVGPNSAKKTIITEFLRFEPQITWLSPNVAKILASEGSPGYHVHYVQVNPFAISRYYSFAISESPHYLLVAEADLDKLTIYSMFDDSIQETFQVPGLIPWGGCEVDFLDSKTMSVKYTAWSHGKGMATEKTIILH